MIINCHRPLLPLLHRLDNSISPINSDIIIQSFSNKDEKGVEPFIKAVEYLLTGTRDNQPINTSSDYFDKFLNLYFINSGPNPLGNILLFEENASQLIAEATQDTSLGLATRYALTELNPFVLDANPTVYLQHNLNGELDLYDETTGAGTLTETYIIKRAELLTALIQRNKNDVADADSVDFTQKVFSDLGELTDPNDDIRISSRQPQNEIFAEQIRFGSDGMDTNIQGGNQNDFLFGLGGNDTIIGGGTLLNPDSDYIEGNDGNDILAGGYGVDTIIGGKGNDQLFGNNAGNLAEDDELTDILKGGDGNDTYYVKALKVPE